MKINIEELVKASGASWRSCKKWTDAEKPKSQADALKVVMSHHRARVAPKDQEVDPATGLTWFKAKLREEAIAKARENRIADKLEKKDYMLASEVYKFFGLFVARLEQVPSKAKSEMGLTDAQKLRLTALIDEALEDVAKELQK